MIIHTTENTPPITAEGIELITAESLPKNDNPINQNEAITKNFSTSYPSNRDNSSICRVTQ